MTQARKYREEFSSYRDMAFVEDAIKEGCIYSGLLIVLQMKSNIISIYERDLVTI